MKKKTNTVNTCLSEQLMKYALGGLLLAAALGLTIISITLLPVVGFVLVIPVAILAAYVIRLRLNDQCQIDLS